MNKWQVIILVEVALIALLAGVVFPKNTLWGVILGFWWGVHLRHIYIRSLKKGNTDEQTDSS